MKSWKKLYSKENHRQALSWSEAESLPSNARKSILASLIDLSCTPALEAEWGQVVWDCLTQYPSHFLELWPEEALDVLLDKEVTVSRASSAELAGGSSDTLSLQSARLKLTELGRTEPAALLDFAVADNRFIIAGEDLTTASLLSDNEISEIRSALSEYAQVHKPGSPGTRAASSAVATNVGALTRVYSVGEDSSAIGK